MIFSKAINRRSFEESDLIAPQSWLLDILGGGTTFSGEKITIDSALLNSNVYTCLSILGGDIGKLPIQVFKTKGKGIQRDSKHPVSKILGVRSNPYMSAYTFKELMQVHLGAWGNAYANIEWDARGYPKWLWPLNPSKTVVKVDQRNGEVFYVTRLPNGEERKLTQHDVLHFKGIGKSGLVGISPISVVREELGAQQARSKFIGAFYANGTSTRGVLKVPTLLDPDAKDMMRDEWQKLNSGLNNAHRIAILDSGLEYQSIGMPLSDAQFIETSKFGIGEVAKIYKIPPHKLGQNSVKYANMEQQSLEYVKNTLQPIIVNWEQEINYKLFTDHERESYYTKFNLTSELRGDSKSRAEYYKTMIETGVYSLNTVLALEEMEGIGELGDKHYMSLNYVSLEMMDAYQMMKMKGGAKLDSGKNGPGDPDLDGEGGSPNS